VADILDRTVTITLRAVSDAYNNSIQAAAKTTDAAIDSITKQVASAGQGFNSLTTQVTQAGTAAGAVSQSTQQLTGALEANTKGLTENAAAAASAASNNTKIAQAASATATAEAAASVSTDKATNAVKAQGDAAAASSKHIVDVGTAVEQAGTKASAAGDKIKESGEKSGFAAGLLDGLKDKAKDLIPGLGGVLSIATGVAGGLGTLQIAEKVGGYLADLAGKALESSGQIEKINETVGKVKSGFEDLVTLDVQLAADAFNATLGPAIEAVIGWITEGLKWLRALADWFASSGTASSAFQAVLSTLARLFKPVIDAVKDLWAKVQENFAAIAQFLQQHQEIWRAVLLVVALVVTNFVQGLKNSFTLLGYVIQGLVWLVEQQFKLIGDGISFAVNTITTVFDKLKQAAQFVADTFKSVFDALPGPVQDAFKAVAQAIEDWVKPIFDFIGSLIDKIPGLRDYKSTFDSISASVTSFGKTLLEGVGAQKQANDASDTAKAKAAELAKAQQALGVMTADQAVAAVKAASDTAAAFTKLVDSHTQNIAQLTQAAKAAYQSLADTRQKIDASGTAEQKAQLDAQIKNIQAWAAANHVALTDVQAVVAATASAFGSLTDYLNKIGFVSKASVIQAAVDSGHAWDDFFDRSQHSAEETAQFIQKQYTALDAQIKAARDAGYTHEVDLLEKEQAKVRATADANGISIKQVTDAVNALNDAIVKLVPATDAADKAIEGWTDDALRSVRAQTDGMDLIKATTDKMVASQLDAITNGYEQQIKIAGQSEEEKVRITQQYYELLKAQVEQYGAVYTADQRDQVQAALQNMLQLTKANDATLETMKAQTKAATDDQAESWTNLAKNMGQAMKKAASSMADALVNGNQSFGEVMKSMLKDLEKAFVQTFLKTGLDAVTKFVTEGLKGSGGLLSSLGSLGDTVESVGKKVASLFGSAGSAASGVASAAGNVGSVAGTAGSAVGAAGGIANAASGASSGAASAASGILGSIGSVVSIASQAVSAIASVIQIFEERGQTKVLENIQQYLGQIYGQLLSVVAPALQKTIWDIANYELHAMDGWRWDLHGWLQGWADRLYGTSGLQGWFAQLWQLLGGLQQAVVAAIQGLGAALSSLQNLNIAAAAFAPVVAAIAAAQTAIVNAIAASADATSKAFGSAGFDPIVQAVNAASAAIVQALGAAAQTLQQAIAGIGSLPAAVASPGEGVDLSPLTAMLAQIRDALSQGSLRPNVTLTVEVGNNTEEISREIVRELQLAGVMR
jgi:phage-related protein